MGIPAGGTTVTQPQNPTEGACSELLDHSSPGAAQLPLHEPMIPAMEGFLQLFLAVLGPGGSLGDPACLCEEGGREQRECCDGGWTIFNWGS